MYNNPEQPTPYDFMYDPSDQEDPGYPVDPGMYGQPGYPLPADEGELMVVPASGYDPATGLADAYMINETGDDLIPVGKVNEEYAWEHDIIVIGAEDPTLADSEYWPIDDLWSSNGQVTPPATSGRTEGQTEFGGLIQITNLNAVEGWVAGKLEFMYNVVTSNGFIAKDSRKFPKVKRKYLRDSKWYDFGDNILDWSTSLYGKHMFELWGEIDWGPSAPRSANASFPPDCENCPAVTKPYSTQITTGEILGSAIVSFSHKKSQVYTMNGSNFKRK
ncbi:hypothetical protein ABDK00_003015 [Niabella insulamsoli]|uniref:hypothetical protein n=1 Tax=Niabella insulamsoli TaxID=3144874 RepID=UPI0031FC7FC2